MVYKGVITANYTKKLLIGIAIVSLLLVLCVATDSATTLNNQKDNQIKLSKDIILTNNTSILEENDTSVSFTAKNTDKIHTIQQKTRKKTKIPTISMWAKPSCGCHYSYTWHKHTFINYCPHCHRYGVLRKNPKGTYEKEYTCCIDDCDYCAVCGKEKYSWSRVYLRRA